MLNHLYNRVLRRLRLRESWIVFFIMGSIMLNFPFLNIFNKNDTILGFPVMFLYFFIGWAISIFIIYLFTLAVGGGDAEKNHHETP